MAVSNTPGQILTGIGGGVLCGLGLYFLITDQAGPRKYNGYYYTAELLGPWSSIVKMLFPFFNSPEDVPGTIIIASIVDYISDLGSGVMNAFEDGLFSTS